MLVGNTQDTTDGPRRPGSASRVSGGRDDDCYRDESRSLSTKRRWIPPSTFRRDALTPENRNDLIFRKVRGILNKLTPEKFEKLSDDLLQTELNSSVILRGVILLIFEKALDEPKYSSMYAQLCKRLTEEAPNFEPPSGPCTFRILLLNKCRAEFENRSHATEAFPDDAILAPEDEEKRQIAKRKMLGNIKFIGELGKLEILAESILHKCIQQLLDKRNRSKDMGEDLECLCQIMKTCGRILDTDKGQKLMDQYFHRMEVLAKNTELPLRIRFMLRDVIELRRDKWVPRKAMNTEGPMPINQICDEDNSRGGLYGGMGIPGLERTSVTNHNRREGGGGGQELFRRQLKTRSGIDDVFGGTVSSFSPVPQPPPPPNHHHDKFNSTYSNGYQSSYRQSSRQNNHSQMNQHQPFYPQNRFNNNQHNNNNTNNTSGAKEVAPRFKRMMNTHQQTAANLENVLLRPAANSMVFKQPNAKPQLPMQPVNHMVPHTVKEAVVVIKPSTEKNKSNKKEKGPSKEEILKKVTSMTEDLIKERVIQDAISAFKEYKVPDRWTSDALLTVLNFSLDKNDNDRELALSLIVPLKKEGLITNNQFIECFRNLVNSMADRETTVPKIYSYVAGFGGQAVLEGLLSLSDIAELTDGGNHYPLFMLTLQNLNKTMGKNELTQLFNNSKINLLNTLPEADRTKDRLSEILEDRNLTFLFPLLRIQAELWKQLEADPNPTVLYKWIKENLDPAHHTDTSFVSALVTVLIKYITQETTLSDGQGREGQGPDKASQEKEKILLEKFKPVLQAFLHAHIDLQVVAVYALQVYCFSIDFPKGMLLRWFLNLYDLEVIEEEAFLKWREDISDAYPGKGKALFQVNSWLTWLAEASSEEEEGDA